MDNAERRSAKRMDINVRIKLSELYNSKSDVENAKEFDVDVINISKHGMAFKSEEKLALNSFFDAKMVLWTKEKIDSIMEIVRMENLDGGPTLYGCRFIGMVAADMIKIQIYEMFNEIND